MARLEMVKCDQCGRTVHKDDVWNWLWVTLFGHERITHSSPLCQIPSCGLHFCSLRCLAEWAAAGDATEQNNKR